MKLTKLHSALAACLLSVAAHADAALSVTFPTTFISNSVNTQANGTAFQQFDNGSVSGYGRITSINGNTLTGNSNPALNLCGSACVLTYVYEGFTFIGQDASKIYFTGGALDMYVNMGTTLPGVPSFQSNPGNSFTTARPDYDNGFHLLRSTAAAVQGAVNIPGTTIASGTVATFNDLNPHATTCSSAGNVFNPSYNQNSNNYSYTCTQPGQTLNNVTLSVVKSSFVGTAYFNAVGGLGRVNFDQNSQQGGSDLVTEVSFNNGSGCTSINPPQYCTGTVLASAFITPATVTLVPAPGTLALGSISLLALGAWRRRKQAPIASA